MTLKVDEVQGECLKSLRMLFRQGVTTPAHIRLQKILNPCYVIIYNLFNSGANVGQMLDTSIYFCKCMVYDLTCGVDIIFFWQTNLMFPALHSRCAKVGA